LIEKYFLPVVVDLDFGISIVPFAERCKSSEMLHIA